jgi:F-type H+-transporting ATPase subunit alpha
VIVIFLGVKGHLDDIAVKQVREFETGLLNFIDSKYADILNEIRKDEKMSDALQKKLADIIQEFKSGFAQRVTA